jgi:hypothetical protein
VKTGELVNASCVQVQDNVYSAATQVLAKNQATVEAVPVCQEDVHALFLNRSCLIAKGVVK